jgi:LDH2 family malate/lactate/ureidoglycolate dehydrogenase
MKDRPAEVDTYPPDAIELLVHSMFVAAGATDENASIVAAHLVRANLSGVDTHGVIHVPGYLDAIAEGRIDPAAAPSIEDETATSARVRGHWGFGHVAALRATETGIAKARAAGMGIAAVEECGHIGRVGHYAELAADAGVVALFFCGGYGYESPSAVPFGGRKPELHTNPIAFAFPGGAVGGPAFDFATTAVAGMKVQEARRHGQRLPSGSIVDRDGRPTDAPEDFFAGGALLPFGGHKGYAIMVQAEWLGRIATGADAFADMSPAEAAMRHQGTLGIFFRSDLFAERTQVATMSDAMAIRIRGSEPAPGVAQVQLPGDPERASRAVRSVGGIPIDRETLDSLLTRARQLGVAPPSSLE